MNSVLKELYKTSENICHEIKYLATSKRFIFTNILRSMLSMLPSVSRTFCNKQTALILLWYGKRGWHALSKNVTCTLDAFDIHVHCNCLKRVRWSLQFLDYIFTVQPFDVLYIKTYGNVQNFKAEKK